MGLDFRIDGPVAHFTINNPLKMNALDGQILSQFRDSLEIFNCNSQVRVGIISAVGNRAFCSGMDLKDALNQADHPSLPPTLMRGLETNKPLIAAINGLAAGGGLELLLTCDIRIAASNAEFGFPEVRLGIIPGWGGTQRIIRQLTWPQAAALLLTGQMIDATKALSIGLVNQVVPQRALISTASDWAALVCQAAPLAVQAAKEAMLKGLQLPLDEGLQLEDALCAYLKTTSDFKEGLLAFQAQRRPDFKGR